MRYEDLPDLPEELGDELPRHAQEIYQAAYNRVYETSMASGEDLMTRNRSPRQPIRRLCSQSRWNIRRTSKAAGGEQQ